MDRESHKRAIVSSLICALDVSLLVAGIDGDSKAVRFMLAFGASCFIPVILCDYIRLALHLHHRQEKESDA